MRNDAMGNQDSRRNILSTLFLITAITGLAACATTQQQPSQALQEARAAYNQAASNAEVQKYAAVELNDAQQALRQTEQADTEDDRQHYAYLTKRNAQIATEVAQRKAAEDRIAKLGEQREVEMAKLEAQQELAALHATQTERGLVMTLGDIVFDVNGATLKPGAMNNIDRLAAFLKAHPERTVTIEGYTDSTGSAAYNEELSGRRAESVREALIARGISPDRIRAVGRGENAPVATNRTAAGRQLNRRVEIVIAS